MDLFKSLRIGVFSKFKYQIYSKPKYFSFLSLNICVYCTDFVLLDNNVYSPSPSVESCHKRRKTNKIGKGFISDPENNNPKTQDAKIIICKV